jgi:hypothetical protein
MTDADVVTRMLHAIDRLDWETVRNCHAGDVRVDYTSLWGGDPATIAIDDLIGQWQETLKGFGATQHLTGPLSVTGDLVETHVTAHHWRASGTAWVVHGHYTARLDGGRISGLTLHVFHASGDPDLPTIPAQRPLRRMPRPGLRPGPSSRAEPGCLSVAAPDDSRVVADALRVSGRQR